MERFTLLKLFEWGVANGFLGASPAAGLKAIKGDADKRPFRTVAEIEAILARGGLGDEEGGAFWDCLYLTPPEIGEILRLVRERDHG